jgi:hypothetical protein
MAGFFFISTLDVPGGMCIMPSWLKFAAILSLWEEFTA